MEVQQQEDLSSPSKSHSRDRSTVSTWHHHWNIEEEKQRTWCF